MYVMSERRGESPGSLSSTGKGEAITASRVVFFFGVGRTIYGYFYLGSKKLNLKLED